MAKRIVFFASSVVNYLTCTPMCNITTLLKIDGFDFSDPQRHLQVVFKVKIFAQYDQWQRLVIIAARERDRIHCLKLSWANLINWLELKKYSAGLRILKLEYRVYLLQKRPINSNFSFPQITRLLCLDARRMRICSDIFILKNGFIV